MRKHKEVIEAWLQGHTIQYLAFHKWEDLEEFEDCSPMTNPELDWRIKPKEIKGTEEETHCISIPISIRALKDFTGFDICKDKNEIRVYFK
jgi:hypothetical protein